MEQQRRIVRSSQKIDVYKNVPSCYPFVKWAGGKNQIISELDSLIPSEFDRYFEPFLGGGAMFFHLASKNIQFTSHLSDINEDLINAFKVVKDDVEVLIRLLMQHEKE